MSRPMVIRYPEEDYTSFDTGFLRINGIVTYFSVAKRKKGPGYRRKANSKGRLDVDMHYI